MLQLFAISVLAASITIFCALLIFRKRINKLNDELQRMRLMRDSPGFNPWSELGDILREDPEQK